MAHSPRAVRSADAHDRRNSAPRHERVAVDPDPLAAPAPRRADLDTEPVIPRHPRGKNWFVRRHAQWHKRFADVAHAHRRLRDARNTYVVDIVPEDVFRLRRQWHRATRAIAQFPRDRALVVDALRTMEEPTRETRGWEPLRDRERVTGAQLARWVARQHQDDPWVVSEALDAMGRALRSAPRRELDQIPDPAPLAAEALERHPDNPRVVASALHAISDQLEMREHTEAGIVDRVGVQAFGNWLRAPTLATGNVRTELARDRLMWAAGSGSARWVGRALQSEAPARWVAQLRNPRGIANHPDNVARKPDYDERSGLFYRGRTAQNPQQLSADDIRERSLELLHRFGSQERVQQMALGAGAVEVLQGLRHHVTGPQLQLVEDTLRRLGADPDVRTTSLHLAVERSDRSLGPAAALLQARGLDALDVPDLFGVTPLDLVTERSAAVGYLVAVGAVDARSVLPHTRHVRAVERGRALRLADMQRTVDAVLAATDIVDPDSASVIALMVDGVGRIEPTLTLATADRLAPR